MSAESHCDRKNLQTLVPVCNEHGRHIRKVSDAQSAGTPSLNDSGASGYLNVQRAQSRVH